MAGDNVDPSLNSRLDVTCYETALCIIPPVEHCKEFDKLRELYDKGYGRWPAHINILYPFVAIDHLPRARDILKEKMMNHESISVQLDTAGNFPHRNGFTVFASESGQGFLEDLRSSVLAALGLRAPSTQFHLTIGQSADNTTASRDFLLGKAARLPPCDFKVNRLAILVRERSSNAHDTSNYMKLWSTIDFGSSAYDTEPIESYQWYEANSNILAEDEETRLMIDEEDNPKLPSGWEREEKTFTYNPDSDYWSPLQPANLLKSDNIPKNLRISSYNILAEADPNADPERYSDLLLVLNSKAAVADVLVLQEVTDSFLSHILSNDDILDTYNFASHAPSTQIEIGPLPSHRNIVILSRYPFTWSWLPFQRRHKGAVIAKFHDFSARTNSSSHPLVVAAIHLTSGLTDGAVAAKKIQISRLLRCLKDNYASSPSIIAGDFNMSTSASTISTSIANKDISTQTATTLASIESSMLDAGFEDCWAITSSTSTANATINHESANLHDLVEGEEGATFNPQRNPLAAETSGTSHNRPQRYDRVFLKGVGVFKTAEFSMFGLNYSEDPDVSATTTSMAPSDHYGVRALIETNTDNKVETKQIPIDLPAFSFPAITSLALSTDSLTASLNKNAMFPTAEEAVERKDAFEMLQRVLSGSHIDGTTPQSLVSLIVAPVGSYSLDVWTTNSDIDCLVIGNISSKTFFALARQRIKQSSAEEIRIIRKVEASSGTLLELSVHNINVDLHYCQATKVVENWNNFSQLSSDDPIFDLPILSLRKLKPYRDLDYMRRTLPDSSSFRLAYRAIKLWAVRNGLYSSKFGYLGGIHITIMLSLVSKLVFHQPESATASEVVAAFFHYYSTFDWETDVVYDTFFHGTRPRYNRSAREPMVILGLHAPNTNVAHTATISGVRVLVKELKAAAALLSDPSMTWQRFFDVVDQSTDPIQQELSFINKFDSFARIDIQYWGRTESKGRALVGWLESRCLYLVVEIQRALPDFEVRIWPARFASNDASEEQDYQGCYLIGLSQLSKEKSIASSDKAKATNSVLTVLARFEEQIHCDEKYYDASVCFVAVGLAKRRDLGALQLDTREWGNAVDEDADSDDDEEDIAQDLDETNEILDDNQLPERIRGSRKKGEAKNNKGSANDGKQEDRRKLRPAADILSRLRWDPSLTLGDYVVGYVDRFVGVLELQLEKWKTEQTDEEFIPQHRILYFKRKSDGVKIWERSTRTDLIFGSGSSNGEGKSS